MPTIFLYMQVVELSDYLSDHVFSEQAFCGRVERYSAI
jgi:hypothetical protein